MPRAGRGGRRTGQTGKRYPNRSDLRAQPVRVPPSTRYGEGAALARAQEAVPLPQQSVPTAPPPSAPSGPMPGDIPLNRPTERPIEPLTAGVPIGPGPGPSAAMPAVDPVVETLRAAYRAFPNAETAALLEAIEGQT